MVSSERQNLKLVSSCVSKKIARQNVGNRNGCFIQVSFSPRRYFERVSRALAIDEVATIEERRNTRKIPFGRVTRGLYDSQSSTVTRR